MDQTPPSADYRRSETGRKRSWYGLKKHVKRFFGWRIPNLLLRAAVSSRPDLRSTGRLPAPASVKAVTGRILGTEYMMLRPDRCVIAKELYWGKGERPGAEDQFAIELFARIAKQSDVMLDIGAYTGIFTLVSTQVNPELEAHAFEIVPEVFHALYDNCVHNDIIHRTTLHHVGVGDPQATMRIPSNSGDSALPSFYSGKLHFADGVLTRFTSLDALATVIEPGSRVVAKIDTEGTEHEIFEHGQEFLSAFHPQMLCEVLPGVAKTELLEKLLSPHGYNFYLVRANDLLLSDQIAPNERFRDWFFSTLSPAELAEYGVSVESEAGKLGVTA